MSALSDEAWEAIARELPQDAKHRAFRDHLAAYVDGYVAGEYPASYMAERKALRAKNGTISKAARTFLETYDMGMAWRPGMNWTNDWSRYDAFLEQLRDAAEHAESNLRKLGQRAPVSTRPRDAFLVMVMELWRLHGGSITTTTNGVTGEADGPLVRYLIAAAGAAGIELTGHQARAFVRRRRVKHPA